MFRKIPIALLCLTAIADPAVADTSRGCNARYDIVFVQIDGGKPISEKRLSFGQFTSRGRCRSWAYANDCRREARSLAHSCMQAHWDGRWGIEGVRQKPGECFRQRANAGPQDYRLEDLKTEIERTASVSAGAPSFDDEVIVRLEGRTWGDKRCDGTTVLTTSYTITQEMCAAVGGKACGE
ncbi:MAG: hypothetical protein R3D45_10020 [Rhizobiaceae bacterium]